MSALVSCRHQNRQPKQLRERHRNGTQSFVAALPHVQRPAGRFDEAALLGFCQSSLRRFAMRAAEALGAAAIPSAIQREVRDARWFADAAEEIGERCFGLSDQKRDDSKTFTGIMTRDTYTKVARLALLRQVLPEGKMTLVSEQEAAIA